MYAAFVIDMFSRRIIGWALSDSMRTEALPLQALNQAIVSAKETTGLIHRRSWADVVDVEIATFEWVAWWNEVRLHQGLGYRTPVEVELEFWEIDLAQGMMEIRVNV